MTHAGSPRPGDLTRRDATRRLLALLTGAMAATAPVRAGASEFMERAFEMRQMAIERGDQPYGAVIVLAGRVVGEGVSAVVTSNDPTAHAEVQAIRDAARRLGTRDLSRCEMYGTSRACTMCEAAAYWAGIGRMFYGATVTDAGAPGLR
jgi:tRNA(Arg) A34 adenosine deaminase TadA